jgi:hypothetical protein
MKILVINAGSSSLKYQLVNTEDESVLAKGNAERIGIADSCLKHTPAGKDRIELKAEFNDHKDAIKMVLEALLHPEYGVIKDVSEIGAVGHRVVHGGEEFSASTLINDEVMEAIRKNVELAPLHNPANIMGIEACRSIYTFGKLLHGILAAVISLPLTRLLYPEALEAATYTFPPTSSIRWKDVFLRSTHLSIIALLTLTLLAVLSYAWLRIRKRSL